MKIDAYPHILPQPILDVVGDLPAPTLRTPALYDVDERMRVMDPFDDYVQVLVPFPLQPVLALLGEPSQAIDAVRAGNDYLASLCEKYPDRFLGFAGVLPLFDPDAARAELVRCVEDLGALGVQLETSVNGAPLIGPGYDDLWAELAARDRTAWLHPVRGKPAADFPVESAGTYALWQALGWPYETSILLARLVIEGLFDRHPDLRVIAHHGAGMLPHFSGRIGEVLQFHAAIGLDSELTAAVERLQRPLEEYFRMFYADTVLFGAGHAVRCVLDYFGADHVLFGSDMPFDPERGPGFIRDTIANVDMLDVDEKQRDRLFEGNARTLLGL